jgi:mRNA-degrading endonuclease RelE of RelBE toxin-antitoxin system
MYEIEFNKQAIKDLKRIPKNYAALIFEKIRILANDPSNKALNTKKLKGIDGSNSKYELYPVTKIFSSTMIQKYTQNL